jgi:hypothetical protein
MPSSIVAPMRCSKEAATAMTFIESHPSGCSGQKRPAKVVCRIPAPGTRSGGRRLRGILLVPRDHSRGSVVAQNAHKRGCAQCAHPGLRIRLYRHRTGPDWGCFRGSGGFSRVGARFESHLGHVFSLFRGFLASECGQIVL